RRSERPADCRTARETWWRAEVNVRAFRRDYRDSQPVKEARLLGEGGASDHRGPPDYSGASIYHSPRSQSATWRMTSFAEMSFVAGSSFSRFSSSGSKAGICCF